MNKKLIAAAVSAAVMAPVAAQADVTLYGRIHNGIQIKSLDSYKTKAVAAVPAVVFVPATNTTRAILAVPAVDAIPEGVGKSVSTTDVRAVGSRFGIKASSDLGNGLTATANYEFAVATDKELGHTNYLRSNDLRVGTVGLSGGFGSVTIGNQWSAFYNTVGTHIDPTFTIAYNLYSSFTGAPYRASNTIKYANSFGPVSLQLDVRLNESGESGKFAAGTAEKIAGDGIGLGLSLAAGDNLTFAVAVDSEDGATGAEDTDRTGLAAKYSGGGFWASIGWHEKEEGAASVDHTQVWVGKSIGDNTSAMIGFGNADDGTTEPSAVSIGVYHNMGGGFKLLYEGTSVDNDDAYTADITRHVFTMRLDF